MNTIATGIYSELIDGPVYTYDEAISKRLEALIPSSRDLDMEFLKALPSPGQQVEVKPLDGPVSHYTACYARVVIPIKEFIADNLDAVRGAYLHAARVLARYVNNFDQGSDVQHIDVYPTTRNLIGPIRRFGLPGSDPVFGCLAHDSDCVISILAFYGFVIPR